jgi:crotonobetainyl-CoA:carnitine CoA-transferase CaiB-like acyl-CoA transferase
MAPIRVLDLSEWIGGGYCASLLSAVGAEVLIGEEPDGHPLRKWSCAGPDSVDDGVLFDYLHGGHRAAAIRTHQDLEELLPAADVVILDGLLKPPRLDPQQLTSDDPDLIVACITPYGLTGPYAGRPGTELVAQADGGSLAIRGHPSRPPIQAGGQSTEWLTGSYAAAGVMALLRRRDQGGGGGLVDVSWTEVASLSCTLFADVADALAGRPDRGDRPVRSFETPSIEPTLDGYVGFNTNTAQMFSDFLVLIDRADLAGADPPWSLLRTRLERWDEWNEIVHAWTSRHTTEETVDAAAELRIPAAPVNDARGVLTTGHFDERGVFVDSCDGRARFPRRPWLIKGEQVPPPAPAPPRPNRAEPPPLWPARTRPTGSPDGRPLPCQGLTVVDLTTWWAGPSASAFLAALGADVIHVESHSHVDGMRMIGGMFAPRPDWWELSSFFLAVNTNKRGITLDLRNPEGRDLLLRLVERADVVMENFTPRVLEGFDLDWDVVHATNPSALMVRMPAFGLDGPWRDRPGFAQTMEQVTGLAWVTGHVDDQPRIQRGPCDPNAGMHAAIATLAALRRRDENGEGAFVEVPMVEAALAIAAEPVIEWTAYGRLLGRQGNRSPRACPQGVYACAGTEQWLALSVPDDATWQALVKVIGEPGWAAGWDQWSDRRAQEDRIDAGLQEWAAATTLSEAVDSLVAAGVPAAPAWDPRRVSEHPQFVYRGFYETVDHPVAGPIGVPTQPLRISGIDRWTARPAPTLGQHNAEVLGSLGLDAADMERLDAAGVTGTRPKGL